EADRPVLAAGRREEAIAPQGHGEHRTLVPEELRPDRPALGQVPELRRVVIPPDERGPSIAAERDRERLPLAAEGHVDRQGRPGRAAGGAWRRWRAPGGGSGPRGAAGPPIGRPVVASQSRAVPSPEEVKMDRPSGLYAMLRTQPPCRMGTPTGWPVVASQMRA